MGPSIHKLFIQPMNHPANMDSCSGPARQKKNNSGATPSSLSTPYRSSPFLAFANTFACVRRFLPYPLPWVTTDRYPKEEPCICSNPLFTLASSSYKMAFYVSERPECSPICRMLQGRGRIEGTLLPWHLKFLARNFFPGI